MNLGTCWESVSFHVSDVLQWAKRCKAAGADAIAVPTDALDTETGLRDLLAVCRAVRCPVVRRDWILHPLQVAFLSAIDQQLPCTDSLQHGSKVSA